LDLSFLFKGRTPPTLAELVLKMTDEELMREYGSKGFTRVMFSPELLKASNDLSPR